MEGITGRGSLVESSRKASLEELSLLLDHLASEYIRTNDKHRRTEIATEISELTARISGIKSRPSPEF